jgi:hypothetical protein
MYRGDSESKNTQNHPFLKQEEENSEIRAGSEERFFG